MSEELPELDPELAGALAAERDAPPLSEAHRARLWARLETAIRGPDGDGGDGSEGGGGAPPPSAGGSPAVAPGGASTLAWATAAFVAGIGVGALGYATLAPTAPAPPALREQPALREPPRAHASEAGAPADPPPPRALEEPLPTLATAVAPSPDAGSREARPTRAGHETDEASSLRRERAVIETARSALARGDAERALQWAERHRRSFPSGVMSEEREVLAIQALAALGRMDEARARAARFASAHPGSFFEPTIRAALHPR